MLAIKNEFDHLSEEELLHLMDLPAWLTLLAAYRADEELTEEHVHTARKLMRMRRYTSQKSLQPLYQKMDDRFVERLKTFYLRLPDKLENKIAFILPQIRRADPILKRLDKDVAKNVRNTLTSFYRQVFRAEKSLFQYFAIPIISGRLEKQSGLIEL